MSAAAASNNRESGGGSFLSRTGDSQLDRLRDRVDYLQERVGSDSALQRHVEAVLTQTLRQSSAGRPEEMAAILAPAVITALQDEIRYSPQAVAEILEPLARPMAGRVVSSMVGGAVGSTGAAIRWVFSPWRWLGGGRSDGAAESDSEAFVVHDCLLIHRTTGMLVVREAINPVPGRTIDAEFVADATAAIVSFVRRAYSERQPGGPSVLSFSGRNWMVRAGMDEVLAFSYSGAEPTGLSQRFVKVGLWLEGSWGRELRSSAGPLPVDRERALSRDLRSHLSTIGQEEARPARPTWHQQVSRWSLVAAAMAGAVIVGVWRYDVGQANRLQETVSSMVAGNPELLGYPVTATFDRSTDHILLSGLMPSREIAETMVDTLSGSTGYPVVRMFSILAGDRLGVNGRPMAEVIGDLGSDVRSLSEDLTVLADTVAQSERASTDWRRIMTSRLGRLAAQVAPPLSAEGEAAGNRLAAWGLNNPITVDMSVRALRSDRLDIPTLLSFQLGEGQFIGLRPLSADGPADPAVMAQAVSLVREKLVANGVSTSLIVDRQAAFGSVIEEQGDGADGNVVAVRLEVVDLSGL